MHRYTVSFRIDGEELFPSEVTKTLNLQPCQIRENPPREGVGKRFRPLWSYSGAVPNQEWQSLEQGILYVLEDLTPKRDLIWSSFGNFNLYWWCGHFQSSFDGGPTFSSELFRKLAHFGAKLYLDTYFSEE